MSVEVTVRVVIRGTASDLCHSQVVFKNEGNPLCYSFATEQAIVQAAQEILHRIEAVDGDIRDKGKGKTPEHIRRHPRVIPKRSS